MASKTSRFETSDYLQDEKMITEYLNEVIKESDSSLLISAISDVAKARGIGKIAVTSGLGRESLYKALRPGAKPRFDTILKVLKAMGFSLRFSTLNVDKKTI